MSGKSHSTDTEKFRTKRHAARENKAKTAVVPARFLAKPPKTPTKPTTSETTHPKTSSSLVARKFARIKKWRPRIPKTWKMRVIALIATLLIGIGGFLVIKAVITASNLFNGGSVLELLTPGTPLKEDGEGRTNIVVFGTSQDDKSHQEEVGGGGLWLTDSIQIMSIDQKNQTVKMVAIPRDLWVKLDSCEVGDYAKINTVYECGSGLYNSSQHVTGDYKAKDKAGAKALMARIQTVTGIQPHYYVHVNYSVLRQAVDAVGGVDVSIVGDGADGIYDTNFDWECPDGNRTCKNVYYPHDGVYKLSGQQALYLARARGDYGAFSYLNFGLSRGDFNRQANQQKIMVALKNKAVSAGVLANPLALSKLLDALGDNVTISFSTGEIKTLLSFAKKLPSTGIQSVSLVDGDNAVVATDMVAGQSVVVATSGAYDYSSIINYLTRELSTNPVTKESASIGVYNGSGVGGKAAQLQSKLQQRGLIVEATGNAEMSNEVSATYTLYNQSDGKMPLTVQLLEKTLGVRAVTSAVPSDVVSSADFVIVIHR